MGMCNADIRSMASGKGELFLCPYCVSESAELYTGTVAELLRRTMATIRKTIKAGQRPALQLLLSLAGGGRIEAGSAYPYRPALVSRVVLFVLISLVCLSGIGCNDKCNSDPYYELTGFPEDVSSLLFSPDGRFLLTASGSELSLWRVDYWQKTQNFSGHEARINDIAFSPDGTMIASASGFTSIVKDSAVYDADNSVRIWDPESGKQIHRLTGHAGWVLSVAFSPDGSTLASSGTDGSVRLWCVDTGEELKQLRLGGCGDYLNDICFSHDGLSLFTTLSGIAGLLREPGFCLCPC